jgi:hypothetical protein
MMGWCYIIGWRKRGKFRMIRIGGGEGDKVGIRGKKYGRGGIYLW